MQNLISFLLIAACLVVIILIVIKKFPALAILDVNRIPGEKETKFKNKIIKARLERDLARWGGFFAGIKKLVDKHLAPVLHKLHHKLKTLSESYRQQKKLSWTERKEQIAELLQTAEEDLKNEDESAAETKLIQVIRLDSQNLDAFRLLGDVYFLGKRYVEAKETLDYALKLASKNEENRLAAEISFSLAQAKKNLDDLKGAANNVRDALELEANNPRYLDFLLELSIMRKDKQTASETLAKLAEVNPENNKLKDLEEQVAVLEDKG